MALHEMHRQQLTKSIITRVSPTYEIETRITLPEDEERRHVAVADPREIRGEVLAIAPQAQSTDDRANGTAGDLTHAPVRDGDGMPNTHLSSN